VALVLVAGAIANKYGMGGEAWVRLSWALGLRRLGLDVFFIEQIARAACVDATAAPARFEESANLTYFERVVADFGLADAAALVCEDDRRVHGTSWSQLVERAAEAALLVNIGGHLSLEPLLASVPRKAYIDIDPGYTQLWHAQGSSAPRLAGHDVYFTIGENIGRRGCDLPMAGIPWRPTRQPVVLDQWPLTPAADRERFTTVATWRSGYGRMTRKRTTYGLKAHEFRKVIDLPRQVRQNCELALDIHPSEHRDLRALRENGWRLVDPRAVAGDPESFRSYVQRSGAEFWVAQGIYAETGSGWFSDRTVRYLASGRPALVQDTAFSRNLPVGDGLIAFRTLDEAVDGARAIAACYQAHATAARRIAEENFDSDRVLARLLDESGARV
jgi:hypothetical protein